MGHISRALIADGEHQRQARTTERILFRTLLDCGLRGREQPASIFSAVLPHSVLARGCFGQPGERLGIVADAVLTVPRDFMLTRAQRRRHVAGAERDALFDAKNLHDGSAHFIHVEADTRRATGVTRRAAAVHREYELSAMHIDEQHHGTVLGMRGGRLTPLTGPGPVQQLLMQFGLVRGCAFGPRAESSAAVQALIRLAAATRARHDYRGMGARSAAEAQSYFVTQLRRTIGIGVFRADAQLRIRRARELRSRARGPEMRWGVRYAEDADHAPRGPGGRHGRRVPPCPWPCARRRRPSLSSLRSSAASASTARADASSLRTLWPACEQPACALWPARISEVGLVRSPGSLLPLARVCPRTVRMLGNHVSLS